MPRDTETPAVPEHHDVVIVGAGQAGLALSWLLKQDDVDHVLLERDEIAHEWSDSRWENFTLVTPNWQCRLPGFPYRGPDPDGFMTRDAVIAYLRAYVDHFGPPAREHTPVTSLAERDDGSYLLDTPNGVLTADQVVIATGGYHLPVIPGFAERIPTAVTQLHSSQYRSPAALPDGAVLVVGSGQSGAQIAEDLLLAGRQVHLAVGGAPRCARFYRGRDCVAWLSEMGHYDRPLAEHPLGMATREKTNHYLTGRDGGRDIDLRAFARDGMRLYGRLTDFRDREMSFAPTLAASLDSADAVADGIKDAIDAHIAAEGIAAPIEPRYVPVWRPPAEPDRLDLAAAGVTTVIWANGYRPDWRWVRVPVFDGAGHPRHHRGVSPVPGLYFLGLPWLHTWGSGRFASVARDARYLAERIGQHAERRHPVDAGRALV